jgi:aminoglycoside 6-adenylyltransferase
VAKHLWRGDLMPAKYSLDGVMKQSALRTLFEWHVEIRHDWSLKPGAAGRGLKNFLPVDAYRSFEETYVGSGTEENWMALFSTIALFRKTAIEVGQHLGYRYPRDLDDRVTAYLLQVRADARSGASGG